MESAAVPDAETAASTVSSTNDRRFADRAIENLYQSYNAKQKRAAFACYVSASVLFDVYCLSVYDAKSPWTWCMLAANVATLLWCRLAVGRRQYWTAVAHLAWLTADIQVVFHMVANAADGADLLGWILLYDYLAYVSLPLTLALCVALGATTCVTYVVTLALLDHQHGYLAGQSSTGTEASGDGISRKTQKRSIGVLGDGLRNRGMGDCGGIHVARDRGRREYNLDNVRKVATRKNRSKYIRKKRVHRLEEKKNKKKKKKNKKKKKKKKK
ncbi:Hypothetical protein CINCED_3A021364 [Cinara cedri]|uniref:Uncharacterized protein n=1 Tax=Cinara cedri TaxID=506608 RepID=A0A5E4M9T0_9HEMI|nr:Hypothetical protein CINCED_3A021364 [Cinara cedri]